MALYSKTILFTGSHRDAFRGVQSFFIKMGYSQTKYAPPVLLEFSKPGIHDYPLKATDEIDCPHTSSIKFEKINDLQTKILLDFDCPSSIWRWSKRSKKEVDNMIDLLASTFSDIIAELNVQASPKVQSVLQEKIIERQIVKVKCRYCGALNNDGLMRCESCGALL